MRNAIHIRSVDAFGWRVGQLGMADGAKYRYIIPADIERSKLPAVSLWTKGRVTGINLTTGNTVAERVPGVLTSELTAEVRAGRYEMTAQEYSEWWCVSSALNGGRIPKLSKLDMPPSSIYSADVPQKILVCSGSVHSNDGRTYGLGESFIAEAGSISTREGFLGLIFEE